MLLPIGRFVYTISDYSFDKELDSFRRIECWKRLKLPGGFDRGLLPRRELWYWPS